MKSIVLFCTLLLHTLVKSQNTPVTQCDNGGILPTDIQAGNEGETPCSESPCKINPGKAIVMNMNFTSPVYMENPNQQVFVDLINTNYPLIEHDVCKGISNTFCPISKGELINHHFQLSLFSAIPDIAVGLRFYILPEPNAQDPALCFNIKVQIYHP